MSAPSKEPEARGYSGSLDKLTDPPFPKVDFWTRKRKQFYCKIILYLIKIFNLGSWIVKNGRAMMRDISHVCYVLKHVRNLFLFMLVLSVVCGCLFL